MKVSENLEVSLFILQSDVQKNRLSPSQQEVLFKSRPVCRAGVCAGATLIFGKTVLSSDSLKVPLATNREKHVYPKEKAEVCPEKTALWQTPAH